MQTSSFIVGSEEVPQDNVVDYSKMTVDELKAIARENNLTGYSTMKKDELINLINSIG